MFLKKCRADKEMGAKGGKKKDRVAEVAHTFEWLITAFVLAFVFRAFVMEAFRIPTGSMADTLLGDHLRLRCRQCGYEYDYGLGNFGVDRDSRWPGHLRTKPSRCPSCGFYQHVGGGMVPSHGDRILVLKCLYQFVEPSRWDVVVFKNPLNPPENYIKRLVGRPGETVEIIDGDVYINGAIARKPAKVQEQLWMVVYDNDYRPVRPDEPAFNGRAWEQPFENVDGLHWGVEEGWPTVFRLSGGGREMSTLRYDTSAGNDFRATYAYDDVSGYRYMPYCSDLMMRFDVERGADEGFVGVRLSKYGLWYSGWVDFAGELVIARADGQAQEILAREMIGMPEAGAGVDFKFANVDHELVLEFGSEQLRYDLGRGPGDAGNRLSEIEPGAEIFGAGKVSLCHVGVFRDIHYTTTNPQSSGGGHGTEDNAIELGEDEFFVLGDNSPRSQDSRWWDRWGRGNNGLRYREGIVPREYLVGKALFVYWPSGFRPFAGSRLAFVPNVGRMRFIYGGSAETN